MNIEELVKDFDPVTLVKFKNYLSENLSNYCNKKNSNSKIISAFKDKSNRCEKCYGKINKNGKTKTGVQKYICSCCKTTYSETTNTVIYHSKLPFSVWSNIIDNLIDGFSIRRIAEQNNISLKTSFDIRHKILISLNEFIESIELEGNIQADEKYFSINLKGTKPKNMPRFSKKRSKGSNLAGLSHHKICVVSAIDENNNIFLKIAGLGKCNKNMLDKTLKPKIEKVVSMNTDSASVYECFCMENLISLHQIPRGQHSRYQININSINCVHSQLATWLSKFRGVSTRHLQQYLNWFNYIFTIKKRFTLANLKIESYINLIVNDNYIKSNNICSIEMPIDLSVAYAEYNYQSLSIT